MSSVGAFASSQRLRVIGDITMRLRRLSEPKGVGVNSVGAGTSRLLRAAVSPPVETSASDGGIAVGAGVSFAFEVRRLPLREGSRPPGLDSPMA